MFSKLSPILRVHKIDLPEVLEVVFSNKALCNVKLVVFEINLFTLYYNYLMERIFQYLMYIFDG